MGVSMEKSVTLLAVICLGMVIGELTETTNFQTQLPSTHETQPHLSLEKTDIDECLQIPSVCGPDSVCINTEGSYNCSCQTGFQVADESVLVGDPNNCTDVDECLQYPSVCGPNSVCSNTVGSYSCSCQTGFQVINESVLAGNTCTDINECVETPNPCGPNSVCTNKNGNYNCACVQGFEGINANLTISIFNPCTDVDECLQMPLVCGPNSACSNTVGSYSCSCQPGFQVINESVLAVNPSNCTGQPVGISLALKAIFETSLNNPESETFMKLATDIETAIERSYQSIDGFRSVNVREFRMTLTLALTSAPSGSTPRSEPSRWTERRSSHRLLGIVIAHLIMIHDEINWVDINQQNANLAAELQKAGHAVTEDILSVRVNKQFLNGDNAYSDLAMVLKCPAATEATGDPQWIFQGKPLKNSNKYHISSGTLRVTGVVLSDAGRYECRYNRTSAPAIVYKEDVSIEQDPMIEPIFFQKSVECEQRVTLNCCVKNPYNLRLTKNGKDVQTTSKPENGQNCVENIYEKTEECGSTLAFSCQLDMKEDRLKDNHSCRCDVLGNGNEGDTRTLYCDEEKSGQILYKCTKEGWTLVQYNCVLKSIQYLQDKSEAITEGEVAEFGDTLRERTLQNEDIIVSSPPTIASIVTILQNIAHVSTTIKVDKAGMEDFLQVVDVIVSPYAYDAWNNLTKGANETLRNTSSRLLLSVEKMSGALSEDIFQITQTKNLHLSRSALTEGNNVFLVDTTHVTIPEAELSKTNTFVTVIVFFALHNIMPNRSTHNSIYKSSLNGNIVLVNSSKPLNNVFLTFAKLDNEFTNPQCVFWDFSLFNKKGGWDSNGCETKFSANSRITCECRHTNSFSILMSPPGFSRALDVIMYTGVGISIGSLVIYLIIEAFVWGTLTTDNITYMQHTCTVNAAVCLLIADVWFIVGASVANDSGTAVAPCTVATFFAHFFYLALLFWMLISAILLLHILTQMLSDHKNLILMLSAFAIGYGAPLVIAVITVASTAGGSGYITPERTCWLKWSKTKVLLAFVIPALVTVVITFCLVMVVLIKMLRRDTAQISEIHTLKVMARCVAILTPLFAVTWGFGIGIMTEPYNFGLHVAFALLNALQGFFILLFGTLLDSKVWRTLTRQEIVCGCGSHTNNTCERENVTSSNGLCLSQRSWKVGYNVSGAQATFSSSNPLTLYL